MTTPNTPPATTPGATSRAWWRARPAAPGYDSPVRQYLPEGPLGDAVDEFVRTGIGRADPHDPVLARTGGPAGNARLTSWLGLFLLVAFAIEGVTLLGMHQLISVHIVVGALVVPPVLLKTATTGWRAARYYLRNRAYQQAGPPPTVLRLVGPLVVVTTLATLGTGLVLILTGPSGRDPFVAPLGFGVSVLTLHQACVIGWFAATTVHVLGRTVPALRIAGRRTTTAPVPGAALRVVAVASAVVLGAGSAVVVLGASDAWTQDWAQRRFVPGAAPDGDHH